MFLQDGFTSHGRSSLLHPNAGARLRSEIYCLHSTLLNPTHGGERLVGYPPDIANDLVEVQQDKIRCLLQAKHQIMEASLAQDPKMIPVRNLHRDRQPRNLLLRRSQADRQ
jgi:hypothetical protein